MLALMLLLAIAPQDVPPARSAPASSCWMCRSLPRPCLVG